MVPILLGVGLLAGALMMWLGLRDLFKEEQGAQEREESSNDDGETASSETVTAEEITPVAVASPLDSPSDQEEDISDCAEPPDDEQDQEPSDSTHSVNDGQQVAQDSPSEQPASSENGSDEVEETPSTREDEDSAKPTCGSTKTKSRDPCRRRVLRDGKRCYDHEED